MQRTGRRGRGPGGRVRRVLGQHRRPPSVAVKPGRLQRAGRPAPVSARCGPAVRAMPQGSDQRGRRRLRRAELGRQRQPRQRRQPASRSASSTPASATCTSEIAAGHFDDPDGNPVPCLRPTGPAARTTAPTTPAPTTAPRSPRSSTRWPRRPPCTCTASTTTSGFSPAGHQVVAAGIKIVNSSLGFTAETRGDGTAGRLHRAGGRARPGRPACCGSSRPATAPQDHWSGTLVDANGDSYVDLLDTGKSTATSTSPRWTRRPRGNVVLSWDQWPTSNLPLNAGGPGVRQRRQPGSAASAGTPTRTRRPATRRCSST